MPPFVKPDLLGWLGRSQATSGENRGGFGYGLSLNPDSPEDWVNIAKTAGTGITGYVFRGSKLVSSVPLRLAVDYIVRNWDVLEDPNVNVSLMNFGNLYAMYAVSKAFDGEFLDPGDLVLGGGRSWDREYARHIIGKIRKDHWEPADFELGVSADFTTALALLILTPGVTERPPVAVARAGTHRVPGEKPAREVHVDLGEQVVLDGSLSIAGRYGIRSYAWRIDEAEPIAQTEPRLQVSFQAYKSNPYTNPYVVTLVVRDTRSDLTQKSDQTDEDTCLVYVHPPPHPPRAVISAGSFTICAGDAIILDGSSSYDPNPGEQVGRWIWTMDGAAVPCEGAGCSALSQSWTEPGSHVVKLVVESFIEGTSPPQLPLDPTSAPVSVTVTVLEDPPPIARIWCPLVDWGNTCPAAIRDTPVVVPVGTEVRLRSDCSANLGCAATPCVLRYLWDTNANQIFGGEDDPPEPEGEEITLRQDNEATLRVCLKAICEGTGASDITCRDIRWTCERPTPVIMIPEFDKRCDPFNCNDGGAVHGACAGTVIHFSAADSNACGELVALDYQWDFTNDGVFDSSGVATEWSWERPGLKSVCLKVSRLGADGNPNGEPATLCIPCLEVLSCSEFLRGDANCSGKVEMSDAVCILQYLFVSGLKAGCFCSACLDAADVNGDGKIGEKIEGIEKICTYKPGVGLDCEEIPVGGGQSGLSISDAIFLLNFLYTGGRAPSEPFPSCGKGAREVHVLGCSSYPCP